MSYCHNYISFRNSSTTWNNSDISNWIGVDSEPTVGSQNLVKSGGVAREINSINLDVSGGVFTIEYIENEYINLQGQYVSYEGWSRTGFIPCEGMNSVLIYTNDGRGTQYCAFYEDEDTDSYITSFSMEVTQTGNITIPESAHYFIFSNTTETINQIHVQLPTVVGLKSKVEESEKDIDDLSYKTGYIEINDESSANLLNLDDVTDDTYIDRGEEVPYNNWFSSEYVQIKKNTSYQVLNYSVNYTPNKWEQTASVYYAFYKSDMSVGHYGNTSVNSPEMVSASDEAYLRISMATPMKDRYVMLTETSFGIPSGDSSEYIPYSSVTSVLFDDVNVKALKDDVDDLKEVDVEIILPEYAVACVGLEFNIYTENVVLCDNINSYDWEWDMRPYNGIVYNQYVECFRVTPDGKDVGQYTITLNCRDKITGNILKSKSMSLIVVADKNYTGKKAIYIGDSLTAAGYYSYEIEKNLSDNGIVSIGTITSQIWVGGVQKQSINEGRGGWSAYTYTTAMSYKGSTNAFMNPNTNKFDFSYYMSNNSFDDVDVVFVNLGTNAESSNSGSTLEEKIDNEIAAMREIIASIRLYDADIPICLHLCPPPAKQDGWTYSGHGYGAEAFFRFSMELNKRNIKEFGTVTDNIYLAPVNLNLDRNNDFKFVEVPLSSRNNTIIKRQANNVHPIDIGYYKFADVYFSLLQYMNDL